MPIPELLREAVERAIMTYDPIRTGETKIDIDIQGSDIVLSGYVRTDVMRSVAAQLAKGAGGGRAVRNNLLSDTELEIAVGQTIELALGTYILPVMPVVRAMRGHIFLRGPVPSEGAKAIMEEVAQQVPGIVMIHNLLDVDTSAIERMIAPKKATRASKAGAAGGG
nr:BON domain-containing protein [Ardenticatenales bacterium]